MNFHFVKLAKARQALLANIEDKNGIKKIIKFNLLY